MQRSPDISWRDHLTQDERSTIKAAELAKASWAQLKQARALIISRATARAKIAKEGKRA